MPEQSNKSGADDNFDRLLAHRLEISELVNSFTSERVQRSAFEALVSSLGLAGENASDEASVGRARIAHESVVVEPEAEEAEAEAEATGTTTSRRRKARSSAKKTFTVPRGLNFAPDGHPTFETVVTEKSPRNHDEKFLLACHYLTEMMGVAEVGIGEILAAYQAAEWTAPSHPDTALRAAASRTGWIDTANTKAIKVVWKGENYLKTKMPAAPKKTTPS